MGYAPEEMARKMIEDEGGPEHASPAFTPAVDKQGPYMGHGNDNEWGLRYADILTRIMNADMAVIESEYDRAVMLELPGNQYAEGRRAADRFWIKLRAAFPDAEFKIEHVIGRNDPLMPPRAALRWSLHGPHAGWDAFGRPSGADVYVMGFSHAEFGPWGLRREWVGYDELAIWRQILMHQA
ncbi:MAG: ester cyclase [Pseudomonadota bacterium]